MLRSYTSRSFGNFGLVIGVSVFLSGCAGSVPKVENVIGSVDITDPEETTSSAYEAYRLARLDYIERKADYELTLTQDAPTAGEIVYSGVAMVHDFTRDTSQPNKTVFDAFGAADATVNFESEDVSVRIHDLVTKADEHVTGEIVASVDAGDGITSFAGKAGFQTGQVYGEISWGDQEAIVSGDKFSGYFFGPNAEMMQGGVSGTTLTLENGSEHALAATIHLER